jgi:2-aminoadipate transaminase
MNLTLDRRSDLPLYRQVAQQISELIQSGVLSPGCRLPTVRQLAADHGLTRLTVQSGYAELQAQGLIESYVGRGTFVSGRAQTFPTGNPHLAALRQPPVEPAAWRSRGLLSELVRLIEQPEILSFAQAIPAASTYPVRELQQAFHHILRQPDALNYGPIQGEVELREQVSRMLLERGIAAPPDSVLISAGAQQGIDVSLRALARPGDVILTEEPIYPGIVELARVHGMRVVTIPMDEGGILDGELEAACAAHHPRLLYTVPTFHNPTGVSLDPQRAGNIMAVARAYDMLILEDDVYGLLSFEDPAPLPLKAQDRSGQVVYITSFSKSLAPGLRLGAVVAAPDLLPDLAAAKQSSDLICSSLLQRVLATYLRRGHFAPHLQQVRALYKERRDALLHALDHYLPGCACTRPGGGLSVWVTLPDDIDEFDYCNEATSRGVSVARGQAFFVEPKSHGYMRLSFGSHTGEQIEQGVGVLGNLLQEHRRHLARLRAQAGLSARPLV